MCISKPQKVLSFSNGRAVVEFEGDRKTMSSPIPLERGDYVLSQAGLVVRKIPEDEAKKMLKEWRELNDF
jgi:hydrogenase assembly chaperone HypC/HupF